MQQPTVYDHRNVYDNGGGNGGNNGLKISPLFVRSGPSSSTETINIKNSVIYKNFGTYVLDVPYIDFSLFENVEINIKYKKTNSSSQYPQIFGEKGSFWKQPCFWYDPNTTLHIGVPSGNDNWDNMIDFTGLSDNLVYTINLHINNISKICTAKLFDGNGVLIEQKSKTFNSIVYRAVSAFMFFAGNSGSHYFYGEIDFSETYIKCDGEFKP